MDFLPVPCALTASATRYALAQRNTMDSTVCSISALLEKLPALELNELDLNCSSQDQALENAFWRTSVPMDKPATNIELQPYIAPLLYHSPLGLAPEELLSPADRNQRYYSSLNALVRHIEVRSSREQSIISLSTGALISNFQRISHPSTKDQKMLPIIGRHLDERESETVNRGYRTESLVSFSDEKLPFEQSFHGL